MDTEEKKPQRGRPKGSRDSHKIKLKPNPKDAKERYAKKYGDIGLVAIYGVDEFTTELVKYMWNDPTQEFIVCDPIEQYVANLTRDIGSRPYSMYRYDSTHHVGFIESGMYPVVVVAKRCLEDVKKLPNPHDVELVCLEDL